MCTTRWQSWPPHLWQHHDLLTEPKRKSNTFFFCSACVNVIPVDTKMRQVRGRKNWETLKTFSPQQFPWQPPKNNRILYVYLKFWWIYWYLGVPVTAVEFQKLFTIQLPLIGNWGVGIGNWGVEESRRSILSSVLHLNILESPFAFHRAAN